MEDAEAKVVVGRNVEKFRKDRGLSRYALAKEADATTIQISRIERGQHGPGPGLMTRIANALKVSLNDLVKA